MSNLDSGAVNKGDGFGLIPVSFSPGPLKRLLGHSAFVVDADRIIFGNEATLQEIFFSDVEKITASSNTIEIISVGGSTHKLICGEKAGKLACLVSKLKDEAREFQCLLDAPEPISIESGLAMFARAFAFRALPYVRAAEVLLKTAADNFFSDVHLEPISPERVRVTFRHGGEVGQAAELTRYNHDRLLARLKYLAGCLSHVDDIAQEGAFKQNNFDVRLSTFPTDNGERASLRIITALRYPDIASLGWKKEAVDLWYSQIKVGRGLYIISGPVGSGKTTAMYATLSQLANNEQRLRVVSIEDPVEAAIAGICQSSLDSMKEKNLAAAFKHLLRQDPNVIALGEIRDSGCIKEALQAALSGHLIIATFHAGSIGETIDRIRQMGVEDSLVMSGLRGVLHLNLLRKGASVIPEVHFGSFDGKELRHIL